MKLRSVLAAAAVVAAGALIPSAAPTQAHAGASFCEGTFLMEGHGTVAPDGTQGGHAHEGEGSTTTCATAFQGLPVGVIGTYDPGDPAAPSEIHVEVHAVTASGSKMRLTECEKKGTGPVSCEAERNDTGQALTLPEPIPQEIVRLECTAHSHARVKAGTTPLARFGCYSTEESETALRQDMGLPPSGDEGGSGGALPDRPADAPTFMAVAPDTYVPPTVVLSKQALAATGASFLNADVIAPHDVTALNDRRPDGSAPWCGEYQPGQCPLFWSSLIPGGQSTPVLGLEDAAVGTYQYTCSIHAHMVGTLEVVA